MDEAFEIAYDDATKKWVRRPCVTPREVVAPRASRFPHCVLVIFTLQAIVALWLLARWRN